ncbi:hypothetical protein [Salipaludibacillus sp. CF4.18]|uniref:hypothetical protein n=1 Tax=Salipaludibacillus sp. CF4.18 TaxID=3373081 RepID=UPI003EE60406
MSLDVDDFLSLIKKAFEKQEEDRARNMWLMRYQNMDDKTFIPFSQFFKLQTEPDNIRPKEDILQEVEEIRAKIRDKKGGE